MKINVDLIYPIGSIYMSTLAVNPETLFGGKWTKIEGRFLLGSSSAYSLGSTGGEATHKLTTQEMPSHYHQPRAGLFVNMNYPEGNVGLHQDTGSYQAGGAYGSSTKETGGDQPHNNMPPYQVVNIWKRTA